MICEALGNHQRAVSQLPMSNVITFTFNQRRPLQNYKEACAVLLFPMLNFRVGLWWFQRLCQHAKQQNVCRNCCISNDKTVAVFVGGCCGICYIFLYSLISAGPSPSLSTFNRKKSEKGPQCKQVGISHMVVQSFQCVMR